MPGRKVLGEVEEFKKKMIVFLTTVIALLLISTLSFMWLKGIGFSEGFILTLETLGYLAEPETGWGRFLQIFISLVGIFLIWWVLWSSADMLIDGSLTKYLKLRHYNRLLANMKNHYIIAGGGKVGEEIADVISKKKFKFVIIENDKEIVSKLRKRKYVVVEGDATNEEILKQANIESAKKIAITLPKSEKNLLITMTAKELNPGIEIYARADNKSITSKLKKAGAKTVVIPEVIAADEIADKL